MAATKLSKIRTEWDLKKFFYKSPKDPQITKDVVKIRRAIVAFEKKYKDDSKWLTSKTKLLQALKDEEKLDKDAFPKPMYYLHYMSALDSGNAEVEALSNKLSNELTEYANRVVFFSLKLGKIDTKLQKEILKDKKFARYHYMLKQIFDTSKYDLTEPEEKILNLVSGPSRGMWMQGVEKLLNKQMVAHKGKRIPINEALPMLRSLPTADRRSLWKTIATILRDDVGDFAEAEINALYTQKKITDKLRGFTRPNQGMLLSNQNSEKSIDHLVKTISNAFELSHDFYTLKARMMKLKKLHYADRLTSIGAVEKQYSLDDTLGILRDAFDSFDPSYRTILDTMIEQGQIDVYPRQSKTGGAFCSNSTGGPTLVLLNHANDFRSVKTFAHEMGHAFHAELAKQQPTHYQGSSLATAETASTFFENLAFDQIFETLSDSEKTIALHDKITESVATVFRQIAVYNFEMDLHTRIREEGYVPKDKIAALMNTHMQSYLGPAFELNDLDGYFFVSWSHIRNHFYVYTYAYGELVSSAMYRRYLEDASFKENVRAFLEAGESASPDTLFKSIGIDSTSPTFFQDGIDHIAADIKRLKKLVDKR